MQAVLTSLIAVCGTLLGSLITYFFQVKSAERNERFQRTERLRQDRLAAAKHLAAALQDYRRVQHDRWHQAKKEWDGPEAVEARKAPDGLQVGMPTDYGIPTLGWGTMVSAVEWWL